MNHEYFMQIALNLAQRGLGNSAPNPSVGCIIVKNDCIVGRGWTAPSGRPHAETQALKRAGIYAQGATAYVTLEPCAHYGKTHPCAQALIDTSISHVVMATGDPNPKVTGKGIAMLEQAEITVTQGVLQEAARQINEGFFLGINQNRPLITLKLALTKNGRISTTEGQTPKITGEIAHSYAHMLRKNHDAIMVGTGTVLADNPNLSCRLPGLEDQSPTRIIIGSYIPENSQCLNDDATTWQIHNHNLEEVLHSLAERSITRLLLEGGSALATSFLEAGLVDRIILIQSNHIMGDNNAPDMLSTINQYIEGFLKKEQRMLGQDTLTIYGKDHA